MVMVTKRKRERELPYPDIMKKIYIPRSLQIQWKDHTPSTIEPFPDIPARQPSGWKGDRAETKKERR